MAVWFLLQLNCAAEPPVRCTKTRRRLVSGVLPVQPLTRGASRPARAMAGQDLAASASPDVSSVVCPLCEFASSGFIPFRV
jgi:hypothetical protein